MSSSKSRYATKKQDNAAKDLLEVGDPSNRKGASKGEGKTNGPSTGELQKPDPETKEPKGSRILRMYNLLTGMVLAKAQRKIMDQARHIF
ncbi:hypothetical protein LR48_Vigan468s000100 [Vigna angularis]|uniref:Uncharacterized protein n=1 Tax=Phaseolus angularis TaxID=3914 RepID=A0A0L9TCF6_PHAAN|nr:hypothetical protein LR48_Vigan468s000100 [Vigna angularis]